MQDHADTSPSGRPGDRRAPQGPAPVAVAIDRENALVELLRIAAPSVATMSSYTVMQFVDKLMVSRIGPDPVYVSAQSNAGILCWTLMTFCVGVTGVTSSFVSQNLGAGRPERGSAYAWASMWTGLVYWAMVLLPAVLLIPGLYQHLHGRTPFLVEQEVGYARVVVGGGVFTLMAKGLHNYFFGLHKPGVVMVAVVGANLVNIFASMVLVFGEGGFPVGQAPEGAAAVFWPLFQGVSDAAAWVAGMVGAPALGVAGAAWGTVLANSMEFGIPLAVFLGPAMARRFGTRLAWKPGAVFFRDLFRVGWPAGLMFVNELVCWSMLMVWLIPAGGRARAAAMGLDQAGIDNAGVVANTAGWITLQWMHLAFMPTVGVSIATQAMIGKAIGARRPDVAAKRTWLCVKVAVGYMGLCALCFVLFRGTLLDVFINGDTPPETRDELLRLGGWLLIGAAVFQVFDALAIITSAALRGAGDTVWPGVATVVLSWTLIVGVGYSLVVFFPMLGAIGPWIGASVYIAVLGSALVMRFLGGRWRSISLVRDPDVPPPVPVAEALANPGPGPDPTSGLA